MSSATVPEDGESVYDYFQFATTTYNGYDRHGGIHGLGALANAALAEWSATGGMPSTVEELRACLFFEARRWRHYGRDPGHQADSYVRSLVTELRTLSGGVVEVDHP